MASMKKGHIMDIREKMTMDAMRCGGVEGVGCRVG